MSNTNWMLHNFKDLDVYTDYKTAPRWHSTLTDRLHLSDEGGAIEILSSVIKFGGLSPLCPLVRGDTVGLGHEAALRFSIGGIYPTRKDVLPKESKKPRLAIALYKSELIAAGARFELIPIIARNMEEANVAECVYEWDVYSLMDAIESEIHAHANLRFRPPLVEDLFQNQTLYWQVTASETVSPIMLYNSAWSLNRRLRLPALRLFANPEDNCHLSKAYVIVDSRYYAESVQNLITGLYHTEGDIFGTPFSSQRLLNTNIIITDEIYDTSDQPLTIEEIEQNHSNAIVSAVNALAEFDAEIDAKIAAAMIEATKAGTDAMRAYISDHGEPDWPCGSACASASEITHPVVQHMIRSGIADNVGIEVLVFVDGLLSTQSRYLHEIAYRAVSKTLTHLLAVRFTINNFYDCDDD